MKILISIAALALLTAMSMNTQCDYGSKKAFAASLRATGHFAKR